MGIDPRVICSSISFRRLPVESALHTIAELGFTGFDLGALPGVCDHVPYELNHQSVRDVATVVNASQLGVVSVNADIGDLNQPLTPAQTNRRRTHLDQLLNLCEAISSPALVLPCGRQSHAPIADLVTDICLVGQQLRDASEIAAERQIQLWVEVLHSGRLCFNIERAAALVTEFGEAPIGVVMDFSHIVASGDNLGEFIDRFTGRIAHVHIRDAIPGDIHRSVGKGVVDFAAGIEHLRQNGYHGKFSLELETSDIADQDRPSAALAAGRYISSLL